mmetsp:Transcript_11856/g.35780  ORF Transcript_11856/g.35780 Transcript_11856/m.35780 type:complete len:202 (-) Transcript_11856:317-922(-)
MPWGVRGIRRQRGVRASDQGLGAELRPCARCPAAEPREGRRTCAHHARPRGSRTRECTITTPHTSKDIDAEGSAHWAASEFLGALAGGVGLLAARLCRALVAECAGHGAARLRPEEELFGHDRLALCKAFHAHPERLLEPPLGRLETVGHAPLHLHQLVVVPGKRRCGLHRGGAGLGSAKLACFAQHLMCLDQHGLEALEG